MTLSYLCAPQLCWVKSYWTTAHWRIAESTSQPLLFWTLGLMEKAKDSCCFFEMIWERAEEFSWGNIIIIPNSTEAACNPLSEYGGLSLESVHAFAHTYVGQNRCNEQNITQMYTYFAKSLTEACSHLITGLEKMSFQLDPLSCRWLFSVAQQIVGLWFLLCEPLSAIYQYSWQVWRATLRNSINMSMCCMTVGCNEDMIQMTYY
jgi:hypothetical protein